MSDQRGLPYTEVPAKRSADKVPVQFDWHDYLANTRQPAHLYQAGERIRFVRNRSTGYEYEAAATGLTSGVPTEELQQFPTVIAETVTDGAVTWITRALSTASLRATILTSVFPLVSGVTLSDQSDADLVHTIYVASGTDRVTYGIRNSVTLSNAPGEIKEAVARLRVAD